MRGGDGGRQRAPRVGDKDESVNGRAHPMPGKRLAQQQQQRQQQHSDRHRASSRTTRFDPAPVPAAMSPA